MSYISTNFKEPIRLPHGQVAENIAQLNQFLKKEELAMQSDFSKNYYKNKQKCIENEQKQALFEAFLTNYKRMIFS